MQPAPPPGWVNTMEEFEKKEQAKAQKPEYPRWETGLLSCFMDTNSCMIGLCCPCVLFGTSRRLHPFTSLLAMTLWVHARPSLPRTEHNWYHVHNDRYGKRAYGRRACGEWHWLLPRGPSVSRYVRLPTASSCTLQHLGSFAHRRILCRFVFAVFTMPDLPAVESEADSPQQIIL
jgi:hypothetical protein